MEKEVLSLAECRLSTGFKVIKSASIWQITYNGHKVLDIDEIEDIFGGKTVPTGCAPDDHLIIRDAFVFRLGHSRDLVQAFGIIRGDNNQAIGLQRLIFYPRDGRIKLHSLNEPNQFGTQFGRKGDLRYRWCFNPHGKNLWHRSGNHRGGAFFACETADPAYGSTQYRINF